MIIIRPSGRRRSHSSEYCYRLASFLLFFTLYFFVFAFSLSFLCALSFRLFLVHFRVSIGIERHSICKFVSVGIDIVFDSFNSFMKGQMVDGRDVNIFRFTFSFPISFDFVSESSFRPDAAQRSYIGFRYLYAKLKSILIHISMACKSFI